jgi:hypothetical protein
MVLSVPAIEQGAAAVAGGGGAGCAGVASYVFPNVGSGRPCG